MPDNGDRKSEYPPDTSWDFTNLRNRRTWKVAAISFVLTGPLFGFLGFWIAYAEGMSGFGARAMATPCCIGLPIPPGGSFPIRIINSLFWAACLSMSLGLVIGGKRKQLPAPGPSGFCRNCGYDLLATPDRCPECGTSQV